MRGGRGQSLDKFKPSQGGEEAPPNGGAILPKNIQMTPFTLEGLINIILNREVPSGSMIANLFLGGHANFDRGHPGLLEHLSKKILTIEMHPTSLGPEKVENEVSKYVKGLFVVGEAPDVITLKTG
jgi:hypothetical protein